MSVAKNDEINNKHFLCINYHSFLNNKYHLICKCDFKCNMELCCRVIRVTEGLECFQSSVAQHLSPHGSFSAEDACGSCLFCPYLGMPDELWQLMSEQPVKETACNEESAAWETDAIIFQIKLFPCSAGAILALSSSMCQWLSCVCFLCRGGI